MILGGNLEMTLMGTPCPLYPFLNLSPPPPNEMSSN